MAITLILALVLLLVLAVVIGLCRERSRLLDEIDELQLRLRIYRSLKNADHKIKQYYKPQNQKKQ